MLPSYYIPHGGGPCFFMDWNPPDTWNKLAAWLRSMAADIPRPKAVVVISGHWEEECFAVQTAAHPPLLFDYYGFPPHTYKLTYPAPGAPDLARRVRELLEGAGHRTSEDPTRGFDHGVFIPFKLIYPDADIPMIQLSLKEGLDPEEHLSAGRAIASLCEDDVLIVGSGMSYHNLREFWAGTNRGTEPFDEWLNATACSEAHDRDQALASWFDAPGARWAHPREEHLLPLMVAAGAAGKRRGERVFYDNIQGSLISAFRF